MKKTTIGIFIILFCLFGMVGISQNKALKRPAPIYLVLASGAVFGFLVALRGRSDARRRAAGSPAAARQGARTSPPPARAIYLVKVPPSREYRMPKVCCSCLGPADGNWPATWRSAGMRHSVDIPFCRTCSKTKYPWWKYREPVSCDVDLRSDRVIFGFDNHMFAQEFASMNGGTGPEAHP